MIPNANPASRLPEQSERPITKLHRHYQAEEAHQEDGVEDDAKGDVGGLWDVVAFGWYDCGCDYGLRLEGEDRWAVAVEVVHLVLRRIRVVDPTALIVPYCHLHLHEDWKVPNVDQSSLDLLLLRPSQH
jgi:hypothetical protein